MKLSTLVLAFVAWKVLFEKKKPATAPPNVEVLADPRTGEWLSGNNGTSLSRFFA